MSRIARKLVLSIVTVVLTVFALGSTTFAWFTLTNTAQVQPFQAQIVADTGIEIAVGNVPAEGITALNWVTTLTTAQMQAFIEQEFTSGFRFNIVTTADGSTFETLGVDQMVEANGGYLEIPLHFRSNTANRILWSQVTLTSPSDPWLNDVSFTYVDGTVRNAGANIPIDASNAMRISVSGTVNSLANIVAYEKPAGDMISNFNVVLGTGGDLSNGGIGDPGAMNYYYAKSNALPFGTSAVTTLATITSLSSNPVVDLTPGSVVDAGQEFYGVVIVRVWLEGWDANAYNSVLNRIITASLRFTGTSI
ncbi:MAG: hypothetical protein CVV62_00810 [Tenericutes bacterium HGW-Tenericutes-7]|nr:MAG: hypothetical protein CVV62_00810 [Tenericutes bacterium HGW-Tenericutes-7]